MHGASDASAMCAMPSPIVLETSGPPLRSTHTNSAMPALPDLTGVEMDESVADGIEPPQLVPMAQLPIAKPLHPRRMAPAAKAKCVAARTRDTVREPAPCPVLHLSAPEFFHRAPPDAQVGGGSGRSAPGRSHGRSTTQASSSSSLGHGDPRGDPTRFRS